MQATQQKTSLLPEVGRVSLGFLPLRFLLKMPPMKKKNRKNELLVTKEGKKGIKKKVILSLILFNS